MITPKLLNAVDLMKEAFSLIKKDKSLLIPPVISLLVIALTIPLSVIFIVLPSIALVGTGQIVTYIVFGLILFIIYFEATFFNAALTWMAFEVKQGKDTTFLIGLQKSFREAPDIFLLTLTSIFFTIAAAKIRGKDKPVLREYAANTVQAGWDVLAGLLLPAMILTDNSFFTAWKEIEEYKTVIPQILVGSFGLGLAYRISVYFLFGTFFFLTFFLNNPAIVMAVSLILFGLLMVYGKMMRTIYFTLLYIQVKELSKK